MAAGALGLRKLGCATEATEQAASLQEIISLGPTQKYVGILLLAPDFANSAKDALGYRILESQQLCGARRLAQPCIGFFIVRDDAG
jgi:hypothetical protein